MARSDQEASMPAEPLVAAADGSEESRRAVHWAAREAGRRDAPIRRRRRATPAGWPSTPGKCQERHRVCLAGTKVLTLLRSMAFRVTRE
jgi:nucleotide-binding universal stress UspA family protein